MTQPITDEMDQEALAYELAAEEAVTATFAAAVGAAVASILAAWAALAATGTVTDAAQAVFRLFVRETLGGITPDMRPDLIRQVRAGLELGIEQALFSDDGLVPPDLAGVDWADPLLRRVVEGVDDKAQETLDEAVRLADLLDLAEEDNVTTVAGKAASSVSGARADTRWSANRAINAGTDAVARANGMDLLWAGERNACLRCLAYFGSVTTPGTDFPAGLTFAAKPSTLGPVPFPPLHPWCRCRVSCYSFGQFNPDADIAVGLAREAERTVLRGWSDFDSLPERLKAADRLLKAGSVLAPTVKKAAREDVKAGKFNQRHRPITNLNA